jgi:voltage-gated potassium channel
VIRAAVWASTATVFVTVVGAVAMRWLDSETFPTIGRAFWWSAQTVTTVGYGDVVPKTDAGRVVAVIVMLVGIGFLTVVTAAIIAVLTHKATATANAAQREAFEVRFAEVEAKLDRIEALLRDSRPRA